MSDYGLGIITLADHVALHSYVLFFQRSKCYVEPPGSSEPVPSIEMLPEPTHEPEELLQFLVPNLQWSVTRLLWPQALPVEVPYGCL